MLNFPSSYFLPRTAFKSGESGKHDNNMLRGCVEGVPLKEVERKLRESRKTGKSYFNGKDLSDYNFSKMVRPEAVLTRVTLKNANFENAQFQSAFFDDANMEKARCKEGIFTGAVFTRTILKEADFTNANLVGACLNGEADLSKGSIEGADLTGACLDKAIFDKTRFNDNTKITLGTQTLTGEQLVRIIPVKTREFLLGKMTYTGNVPPEDFAKTPPSTKTNETTPR